MKITDVLSLRNDLTTSWELLQQESAPVKKEILNRFIDTENRIGATTDVYELQRLDAFRKFLKKTATQSDAKDQFIERMIKNFNAVDDAYWTGALQSQKLIDENAALKMRIKILENGLRSALNRRQHLHNVVKIGNTSTQAAA